MKKSKALWLLSFFGVLFTLSGIVLGGGLIEKCLELNGDYSLQKVMVAVKKQLDPQGLNTFTMDEVTRLEKELSNKDISAAARSGLINNSVSFNSIAYPASINGVDSRYPKFTDVSLEKGSFITSRQEEEGAMVAVIDYDLALDIFKTSNVTGQKLEIFGAVFIITGVVKKDDSLMGKLTDSGIPQVYIPVGVMLELDRTAGIETLQIRTGDASTLDQNRNSISSALRQIGKNPSNYSLSDYNIKLALMKQLPKLYPFVLGAVSIIALMLYLKKTLSRLYSHIRAGCRTDYILNVVKSSLAYIGACLLEMLLSAAGIVLLWLGIRFELYIPPNYIPDELINISYYQDLLKAAIQGSVQNMGYIASRPELLVNTSNILLDFIVVISAVLGAVLLYAGFRESGYLSIDIKGMTAVFAVLMAASLAILAMSAFFADLPFMPDIKSILVVWAFIYIKILFNSKREESGI